jgi:hypothetical protein
VDGLMKGQWLAWCPTCGNVRHFGKLYRDVGWHYCDRCKVTIGKDPRWPGTPYRWVPPDDGDGALRVWLEEP